MTNSKLHEDYELVLREKGYGKAYRSLEDGKSEEYENAFFQFGWTMFKASRSGLIIELPNPDHQCDDSASSVIYRCIQAIEAAGVKVIS